MRATETGSGAVRVAPTAALIVGLLGLVAAVATGAETGTSRLERKVQVLERVFDEVLQQSPNVVVMSPRGVARGVVLEGYGAVFMLSASLPGRFLWSPENLPRIAGSAEDHNLFMFRLEADGEQGASSPEEESAKAAKKRAERLAALKTELTDAMLDYGPTLTELPDDSWLAVAAFLGGDRLLGAGEGTRLVLRARMRDLRQYTSGALSREAAAKRVMVEQE